MPVSRRHPILAAAAAVLIAAACRGGAPADAGDDPLPEPVDDVARVVADEGAPGPAQGDPESVVVAAMILTTGGDLDAALADGVITADDVEAARRGLADGSLDALFD